MRCQWSARAPLPLVVGAPAHQTPAPRVGPGSCAPYPSTGGEFRPPAVAPAVCGTTISPLSALPCSSPPQPLFKLYSFFEILYSTIPSRFLKRLVKGDIISLMSFSCCFFCVCAIFFQLLVLECGGAFFVLRVQGDSVRRSPVVNERGGGGPAASRVLLVAWPLLVALRVALYHDPVWSGQGFSLHPGAWLKAAWR